MEKQCTALIVHPSHVASMKGGAEGEEVRTRPRRDSGSIIPIEVFARIMSFVNCHKTLCKLSTISKKFYRQQSCFVANMCIFRFCAHPKQLSPSPDPKTLYMSLCEIKKKVLHDHDCMRFAQNYNIPIDVAASLFSRYSDRRLVSPLRA